MRRRKSLTRAHRHCNGAIHIVEFGAAIYMLFFCIAIPAVILFSLIFSFTAVQWATDEAADSAVKSCAYDKALTTATSVVRNSLQIWFGNVRFVQPAGGFEGSGVDLFVDVLNKRTGACQTFGPNMPLSAMATTDTTARFSYRVVTHFQTKPLLRQSNLLKLALLTQPLEFTCQAVRPLENPESAGFCLGNDIVKGAQCGVDQYKK